jgi:hypothetical protein
MNDETGTRTENEDQILDLLASCPQAGDGVHNWLFRTAAALHGLELPGEKIVDCLTTATERCGRAVPSSEITAAVKNSSPGAWVADDHGFKPWPARNESRIKTITGDGPKLADLEAMSPVRFDDGQAHSEEIIDAVFPGNPLLCVALKKKIFDTRPRETWRGLLSQQQFIVPSPMSAPFGKTKEGNESKRSLSNTGPRKYLVTEYDQGTFDDHAALTLHLAQFAPLVLAVHSGSKSLHAWWACGHQDEKAIRKFMEYAVSLGADRATWTKCQLVRLPDGMRDNGKRQRTVFFNPSNTEVK